MCWKGIWNVRGFREGEKVFSLESYDDDFRLQLKKREVSWGEEEVKNILSCNMCTNFSEKFSLSRFGEEFSYTNLNMHAPQRPLRVNRNPDNPTCVYFYVCYARIWLK